MTPEQTRDEVRAIENLLMSDADSTRDDLADESAWSTPADRPTGPGGSLPLPAIPGYAVEREIARGGMGRVLAGRELALDREVAIKVLLPGANAQRFVTESRITAKLPHPNIPPVYALGTLADGSPFLAMKFVRGHTLADELKSRPDPLAELSRFVQTFEQIALAVGFAHSRGVIHRDLKPANVMVGEFGEVQVMDWGLARSGKSEVGTRNEGDGSDFPVPTSEFTQAGAVMGTPAYMAPEQARGEGVDARADVFALGGILCAILTGQPVFGGRSVLETVQQASAGNTADALARLDACGADAELVAVAVACLRANPTDRPADGRAVAELVADYRHGVEQRLRNAEADRAAAAARDAEQRKRRRAMLWAGGVIVAVLVAGAAVSLWQMVRAMGAEKDTADQLAETEKARGETARQLTETEKARGAAADQLKKTQAAEATAQAETKKALVNLGIANERTQSLSDAYGDIVFGIQNKLANRPGTLELSKELLGLARDGLMKVLDDARKLGNADHTIVMSHIRLGEVELRLGNTAAAKAEFDTARDLCEIRAASEPKNAGAQRNLAVSYEKLGYMAQQLGQTKDALVWYRKALDLCEKRAAAEPKNTEAQRDLGVNYEGFGEVTLRLGQTKDALDWFRKALDVREKLAAADPKNAQAQRDLNVSHNRLGDVALKLDQTRDALAHYRKAQDIAEKLASADPLNPEAQRDVSVGYNKLGDVMLQLGQTKDALAWFRKGLDLCEKRAAADPANAETQRDLSVGYNRLGNVARELDQDQDALGWYRKALGAAEKRAATDPRNAEAQLDLSAGYFNLGDMTRRSGQVKGAPDWYRKSLDVAEKLVSADPKNALAQRMRLMNSFGFGAVSQETKEYAEAIRWYEKALAVAAKFDKPEFFASEVKVINGRIATCKAALAKQKPREPAPPPNPAQ